MAIVAQALSGGSYTQNFNTLATSGTSNLDGTLPIGWGFVESGSGGNLSYAAGDGSSSTGNTHSFGTGTSSERALGEVTSTTVQSTLGGAFVNNTGRPITVITIAYTGEQWRLGDSAAPVDQLNFQYSTTATSLTSGTFTDVNALDFASPNNGAGSVGALNGNAAGNRTVLGPIAIPITVAPGSTFYIRWVPSDVAGNDDGLAIDDFTLTTAGPANTAPTNIALAASSTPELAATGTLIGMLSATDDAGTPTFTLLNSAGGRFQINGNRLEVADGLLLDFEQSTTHLVTVRVTDPEGLSFTKDFTINIANVDPETVTESSRGNTFFGGPLNDTFDGGGGNDTLVGGGGNDTLVGGTGNDSMVGGSGNDIYSVDSLGDTVTENAGEGNDTVNALASFTLGPNIENLTLQGGDAIDGSGNDLDNCITGNASANALDGGAGNDTIDAGTGNDSVNGGSGNDVILGQDGNDTVDAGDGDDRVNTGSGNDLAFGGNGSDEIGGGAGDDTIVGQDGNDVIFGEDGIDIANAGTGDDIMVAGLGNDTFGGGSDNDVLIGGDGDDLLFGEDGVDNINGEFGNDGVVGGTGNDTLGGGAGNDVAVGDDGDDALFGETGDDAMNGGFGDDILIGGDGDDVLGGGAGDDDINGGFGNDTLFGENGLDILNGSAGNDVMIGGGNDDTYVFAPNDGADTIGDFFAGGP